VAKEAGQKNNCVGLFFILCWCLKTKNKDMTLNVHMANEVLVDAEIIFKLMGK
jgi:hypothetical protein